MKVGYIYKVTCLKNNKIYIGQTSRTIEERWKEHLRNAIHDDNLEYQNKFHRAIRKYGKDLFKIEMVVKITTRNNKQLQKALNWSETYYIQFYDCYLKGYNSSWGGDINPMWGRRGKDNPCSRKYNQYTLDGKYIRTWDSYADIIRYFGKGANVIPVCDPNNHRKVSAKGFIWRWADQVNGTKDIIVTEEEKLIIQTAGKNNPKFKQKQIESKKVCQYDLDGDLIKIYNSISEAAKAVNGNSPGICRVLKGQKKSHKDYMWTYYDENVGIIKHIDPWKDSRFKN